MMRYKAGLIWFTLLIATPVLAIPYEDDLMRGEGELILEGVIIRGNWNITDDSILDMLKWEVGDPFDETALAQGQTRLEASELFREVELSTRRGSEPGSIIVIVRVREKRLPYIDWFEARQYPESYSLNIFELETYTKDRRNHLKSELRLTEPWMGLYLDYTYALSTSSPLRLYLNTQAGNQTWNVYPTKKREGFDFNLNRLGGGAGLQYTSATFGKIRLGADVWYTNVGDEPIYYKNLHDDDYDPIDSRDQIPPQLREVHDTNWTGVNLTITKDKRDSELYPHDGSLIYIPIYAATDSYADQQFVRVMVDARKYFPMGSGSTLALRARGGLIEGEAPFYQRFSIVKGSGMRGIEHGWADPPFGGTRMFQASFELRKPLTGSRPNSFISLLLFAEAGANWNDDPKAYPSDPDYSEPVSTIGWGLSFRLPVVGPLAMHVSYPMLAPGDADGLHVQVDLGMAF
ncbi:BamA/TamA family outer membrane protein [bacterium]|nr:BamA/TamA family outer membrane protein [bacterium]